MYLHTNSFLQGGKYKIERVLEQGGFSITYLGTQVALNRKVAIKEFFMKECCNRNKAASYASVPLGGSKELVAKFKAKFIKEAQIIAKLNHPHIIRIHDIFEENGTAYYVMEYWNNGSLAEYVKKRGRLNETEALHYIRQIADALRYIHNHNMNHLDVKPSNILLDENKDAVLIGFGLSKQYDQEGKQTSTTPVEISYGYAPLEQYKKGGVGAFSPATDIYSLGATLYKLLTGQTPPDANDVMDEGLPPLPSFVSLSTILAIKKAMQTSRKDRPQSVTKFLAILEGEATVIELGTKPKRTIRVTPNLIPKLFKKWIVLLAVCVVVALLTIIWLKNKAIENVEITAQQIPTNTDSTVMDSAIINGHRYVDLGLSVKWADCNIGASSPSDYGDYFAWGEILPKQEYTQNNYNESLKYAPTEITAYSEYDAARYNWKGSWRLPTRSECRELIDKCIWRWTTLNGHNGYKVIGPNGNNIFLPAAGKYDNTSLKYTENAGWYWVSTAPKRSNYAVSIYFNEREPKTPFQHRYEGRSIRPVTE